MSAKYFISLLFLVVLSCNSKYNKNNHLSTIEIGNNIYYEKYKVFSGGVYANDSYSHCLTDSVSFRKYVGTIYYDDEHLFCKSMDSNTVIIFRAKRSNLKDTLEKHIYLISDLKREGKFE
jgi:hypothetical protein